MYKKLSQLSFVIGLFFFIVALILVVNAFLTKEGTQMNLYTALVFFVFGLAMMLTKQKEGDDAK